MKPVPVSAKQSTGFTLFELLLVVVIISLTTALMVVNISLDGIEEKAEEEIIRLQQLLRFAQEQSVIRSQEYGIRFYRTGYRFMQLDENDANPTAANQPGGPVWVDINNDRVLRSRTLEQPLELELYIDQASIEILNSPEDDPEPESDESQEENPLASVASEFAGNLNQQSGPSHQQIKPQVFLLSSSELEPEFEVVIRVAGQDIQQQLKGLAQGTFERVLDE